MDRPGWVVVGVSGSLGNLAALHVAAATAVRTRRTLVAVRAWSPPGGESVARRSPCPQLDHFVRDASRAALAEALAAVPRLGAVQHLVLRGRPEHVLLATASESDDLLVVGTGRQGGIMRAVHGTVTRYCVAHAHCPVLAVPPSELTQDLSDLAGRRVSAISTTVEREGLRA
jgi:nucleotide-binding universal stress UspA family protein